MTKTSIPSMSRLFALSTIVLMGGCYDEEEHITVRDLTGTVRIPVSMLDDMTLERDDGTLQTVSGDYRMLGPVYLGVYASIQDGLYSYPHPEIGPVLDEDTEGNAYPYGGTTIGRFDFGCYEQLTCKMVTGRFTDYDDVLDFFSNRLESPINNQFGNEVTDGLEYRERCYELQYLTGDAEVRFVGPLDFEVQGDELVAEVTIYDSDWREGVQVWGWVDMPDPNFRFATCNDNAGDRAFYYDQNYLIGTNYQNLLNFPGTYIGPGDVVAAEGVVINDPNKSFDITLGLKIDE